MTPEPLEPDEILDAVEDETEEQAAIDDRDVPPAVKVEQRDAAREALASEVGDGPDGGPNPS